MDKICGYCGSAYSVPASQFNRSKFCSDSCMKASKKRQQEYSCDYCGRVFQVHTRKIEEKESGKRKFVLCSTECAKNIQKPTQEEVRKAFSDRGYMMVSDQYISAKIKIEYICSKHQAEGVQGITYGNLINGFGCKYCGRERTTEARRLSFEDAKAVFAKNNMTLCDQEYVNAETPLAYICNAHPEKGIQYKTLGNARSQHCPYCRSSKGEKSIREFLNNSDIKYIEQKQFDDLLGLGGGKLSYDFFLPEFNILIEYQGEFHIGVPELQSENALKTQQEHDRKKREYARSHNIELIEIWYYEKDKTHEILSNKLLTHLSLETAG